MLPQMMVLVTVIVVALFAIAFLIAQRRNATKALFGTAGQTSSEFWVSVALLIAIAIGFWIPMYGIVNASVAEAIELGKTTVQLNVVGTVCMTAVVCVYTVCRTAIKVAKLFAPPKA